MKESPVGRIPMEYIVPDTGEVVPGYWAPTPERFFYKHEKDLLVDVLESSTDKRMVVLSYLLDHMSLAHNTVKGSYTKISKDLKLSRSTIVLAMTELQKMDCVRLVQQGLWMVNPRLHSRGYETTTRKQIQIYYNLETLSERRKKAERTDEDVRHGDVG